MHEEVLISGFGGQGIMFMGRLLARLGMEEGLHVTWMPSYGAEVRGGVANCTVILSSSEIPSPLSFHPTSAILMNEPSLQKYEPILIKGGLLLINSSMVGRNPQRDDLKVVKVPASGIAKELGDIKVANMVLFGAYLFQKKVVPLRKALLSLKEALSSKGEELLELNRRALQRGFDFCK